MFRVGALVAVAAALVIIPTLAGAHTARYPTSVTIHFQGSASGDSFSGKVKSPRPACVPNRRVKVVSGDHETSELVGATRADANGRWTVDPPGQFVAPGDYHAFVPRKVRSKPGHRHICKAATAVTTVGGP
jgi:hypothetical protein